VNVNWRLRDSSVTEHGESRRFLAIHPNESVALRFLRPNGTEGLLIV
jgi:hypothetical protein